MSQENDVFSSKSSELKDFRNFKFNITEKTQIPRKSWDSTNQNPNSVDYSKKQKPIFVFNENNLQNNKFQSAHTNKKPRQSIFQPQGKINDQKYIMLNFISPYYESGILINDTLKIFKKYMKIDFWFDVIPLIQMTTYDVQLVSVESKLVLVLQLLRLKQISRICKKLFNHFNLYEIYPNVMILSNLCKFKQYDMGHLSNNTY
ncbi:hypothetical protein PPERSA_06369 [Pseudocohnilembus persalinus]|uniref:Uncharacterized protein n=1 Tax=Pseudocohnilembus persalinus TaxID=266149 RepID=A0A0V0QIX4_PSEPJ|nr:hypothetical protein PPERSA_06369 [Pseudocohnilembus persalinus]|eukprot:KRX02174.1 hypothetical protein PPERSA_06369 [Pseudocohnilembus persalinus]